ncbi:IS607 family element RNA-guided endonuclease TnpB [Actinocorallia aurea]
MVTFSLTLTPTAAQDDLLRTAGGAARSAYNRVLALVKDQLAAREVDLEVVVPWSRFDLINAVNAWKREALDLGGHTWHLGIPAVLFEEAVTDLAAALAAFSASRSGARSGPRMRFPVFKKKNRTPYSFRIRNKNDAIKVGATDRPRAVRLPKLGLIGVKEDTRRLRRLLRPGPDGTPRTRICSVTVRWRRNRWAIAITVAAPDLHASRHHPPRDAGARGRGWVGVDLGLNDLVVAATDQGEEVLRVPAARTFQRRQEGLARRQRRLTRKEPGSKRHGRAVAGVREFQAKTAAIRGHLLHRVSNLLVNNHDQLVLEHLNIRGMMGNRRLAKALTDASFAALAQMIGYKADWRHGTVVHAERWFPSSKTCSACGHRATELPLSRRVYQCDRCGLQRDRDLNAAINLARQGPRLLVPPRP